MMKCSLETRIPNFTCKCQGAKKPEWNPAAIREEYGLKLTEAEKTHILAKMPPPDSEGKIYADAIFEGGGVRGIAFLGALRCCSDIGLNWRKLAGTSAGAITAAFLAAGFNSDRLEDILGKLDFMEFLSQKTSPLILNGDPANDLQFPIAMMLTLALSGQMGEYSSDPFRNWLAHNLDPDKLITFKNIKEKGNGRELKVVVSDITRGQMLVLPDDLDLTDNPTEKTLVQTIGIDNKYDFSIAEAVRLSMSIPMFFAPGKLGDYLIVDGGLLSNFPLWIYDLPTTTQNQQPSWFTFGFRLDDQGIQKRFQVKGPFTMLAATFRTMMSARDRYHQREMDRGRVIHIDVTQAHVTTTDFNLCLEQKKILYRLGYQQTKNFFLHTCHSWQEHLAHRGFSPACI